MVPVDVSVVVPVFRNAGTLVALAHRLRAALSDHTEEFRVVFVVDGSPDASWDVVCTLAGEDARFCGLRLETRGGQHAAVVAGLALAGSRWCVVMDADLQDPPEAVPTLLARAKELGGTVFARRRGRYQRWDRLVTSRLFKTVLRLVSGVPQDVGTFFVVDAAVAAKMCRMPVTSPQVVILAHHCSTVWDAVPVTRAPREIGRSAYSSMARVRAGRRALRCALECRWSRAIERPALAASPPLHGERVNL